MQKALARVRNPALRQGIFIGIILGVVLVGLSFIIGGLIIIVVLTLIAAYFAGLRASRETGRMTTGTFAGLWTGIIGVFILSIFSFGFLLFNLDAVLKNAQITANQQHEHIIYTNSTIIINYLSFYLFLIVLGILFGVIGGLVGGLFGTRRPSNPPVEEYKEAMYETPSTLESEELPPASEVEGSLASSESEELPPASEMEEPVSETPPEESSSTTQQAE
jgi:hypothetical protein